MIAVTSDLDACLAIRMTVFVQEQNVPEELERDEHDATAIHLLAWAGGRPVGTARIMVDGMYVKSYIDAKRGTGLGAALIRAALEELRRIPGVTTAKLGAQTHALGFYEKLGFTAFGPEYDDAGIPHRDMMRAP
ncbi:MAG TPA: GNAT family N-acetyltransferase [Paracoccus sp. (in: a-proteobacteria)]|nr:GNAT family N-acetyltransferase [Paracoccus sp. (in: a-proteobacteria)]